MSGLYERRAAVGAPVLPDELLVCGYNPKEQAAAAKIVVVVGVALDPELAHRFPVADLECVRNDASTGFQTFKLRTQAFVNSRQKKQRHDGGFVKVGLKQILLAKLNAVFDSSSAGVLLSLAYARRIDVDPDSPCTVILGGGNYDPAIATP